MKRIFYVSLFLVLFVSIKSLAQDKNENHLGYKGSKFYSPNKIPHVLLNRSLAEQSQISWGTGNHTASPVPVGSVGPDKFISKLKGIIPNTKIAEVVREAIADSINVMLVIGDGMGINQMSLPIYMNLAEGKSAQTYFEKIMNEGETGIVTTNTYDGLVTCSAASGTALACGVKTRINIVGCDSDGNPVESVLSFAEKNNYLTGLVTDASITDATGAVFYAHEINRNNESDIAAQLVDNNEIEVILAGGASFFIPEGTKLKDETEFSDFEEDRNSTSSRNDKRNLISELKKKDYKIINTKTELENLNSSEKVFGVFSGGGISAAIDRDDELTTEPSLVMMAEKNLQLLSGRGKKYFTMIECARIDWEAHDNDGGAVYKAVEEMNLVLEKCYQFYQKNPDKTLLIFTADHETGGFSISYTKYSGDNIVREKLASGKEWESDTNPLSFREFAKLKEQKMSIYKIFEHTSSFEEFYKTLNDNLSYKVSKEDAEEVYNSIRNYRKAK